MDSEFKRYHLTMVDIIKKEEDLDTEQAALGEHNDRVADLLDRLALLVIPEVWEEKGQVRSTAASLQEVAPSRAEPTKSCRCSLECC